MFETRQDPPKEKFNLYIFNLSAKKLQTSSLVIYLNLPQALLNNFSEKENCLKKKSVLRSAATPIQLTIAIYQHPISSPGFY